MVEFAYNNAKNASTNYTSFELNCGYHPCVSYEENLDPYSKSKTIKKLFFELQDLMVAYQQNLYHTQKFQKQAHNKGIKPRSYALGKNVWLNSKYLKTKQNCKLRAKFLGLFWLLHPINKQAYKLKLPKK